MNKKNINVYSIIIFSQRIFNRANRIEKEFDDDDDAKFLC